MYQVPVQRLDRIRTSRKRVKEILTDIGLDSCQDFLKEDKSGDNGEQCFENTEWNDLTDCYQTKRKKWCYRTQPLCCSLCWFSCRSWQTFRNHVQRCHDEEGDLASLSPCPACAYISRPDLLSKHAKLFHAQPPAAPAGSSNGNAGGKVTKTLARAPVSVTQAGVRVTTVGPGGDKYSCAACGYHDSLLYVMRKHVLLTHCKALLQRYYGCQVTTLKKKAKPAPNESPGSKETWTTVKQSKFSCCVCKMPAETSEHLLYHLLSSAKHQELQAHIKPLLVEHCSVAKIAPAGSKPQASELPHLAPRAMQQVVSLVAKGMVNLPPVNGKSAPPKKAVLLASHSQPTSLVCSAGGGGPQVLVANQKAAAGVAVRAAPGQPSCSNKPVSFVMSSGAQGNQIPLTMTMAGSSPGQTQQVLLPAGLTLNLGTKMGSVGSPGQPLLFSQGRGGQIEMQVTTSSGQQMVLTQGKATTAGASPPQPLLSDGKASGGPGMVLTQGKTLGPAMVLAPSNTNSFAAMAPNQSLLIGGQVGSVRPMMLNQGLSIQSQQQGGTLLSSHQTLGFIATGNKMVPGQSLMLNQGLSLQTSQPVRLIPTGNKVNGMPTYTLAAVQMAVPVQSGVAKPPVLVNVPPPAPPATQANPGAVQTNRAALSSPTGKVPSSPVPRANPSPVPAKRAAAASAPTGKATAPPVPQANLGAAQTQPTEGSTPTEAPQANTILPRLRPNRGAVSSPKGKALGAKSQFVTWSASGVLECLLCQSVLPNHGLYSHLLHGMKCLLCPLVFYTFRQLVSHCDEAHGLAAAANRDQLWKNHRLLVTKDSRLLSPTPVVSLKVPKDLLGCPELHLALVHKDTDLEVMHLQLTETLTKAPGEPATGQPSCPFCTDLRPHGPAADVQHLRRRHHVMHAIHAILKTPAFKCVYCLGVYMEPSSARTISIHVQRCRCAPHSAKEAERRLNPDPASSSSAAAAGSRGAARGGVAAAREGLEAPPTPEPYVDSPTEIPAGLAQRPLLERKLFLNTYFHKTPYPTRKEIEFLVLRLKLSQPEVTSIFSSKRRRCREDCRRRGLRVLLGFDSSYLKAVKHNLVVPHGQTSQGPRASADTQTPTLVECKQEPPDPVEIVGPFGDHPYAEPLTHPGSLQCKKEDSDRTESGDQSRGTSPEGPIQQPHKEGH